MLDPSERLDFDLGPVDTLVEGLVDEADDAYVVATHEVETECNFGRRFVVIVGTDNSLDCVVEGLDRLSVTVQFELMGRSISYQVRLVVDSQEGPN